MAYSLIDKLLIHVITVMHFFSLYNKIHSFIHAYTILLSCNVSLTKQWQNNIHKSSQLICYARVLLTLCASHKSDARCQIWSFLSLQVLPELTPPCSVLASGNPVNQHIIDKQYVRFLSCSAMLRHDFAIGGVSICLSVCPSHVGTESKLMTTRSCSFHHRLAQGLANGPLGGKCLHHSHILQRTITSCFILHPKKKSIFTFCYSFLHQTKCEK